MDRGAGPRAAPGWDALRRGLRRRRPPGAAQPPLLYRSLGATFARVAQGDLPERSVGNSDTDLAVAPDGTLYHVVMHYLPWGHAIVMGVSADKGDSWRWRTLAAMPWVDRPWVEVGPDGTARVTWSGPLGLHHAASRDGGASWTEGPLVHRSGGSGVGPGGELAATWFSRIEAPTAHVSHVSAADAPTPVMDVVTHEMETTGSTRGECFQATRLQGGGIGAALPIYTGDPATSGFASSRAGEGRKAWGRR